MIRWEIFCYRKMREERLLNGPQGVGKVVPDGGVDHDGEDRRLQQPLEQHHEILKQYWGYTSFRPLQKEIIHSVCAGKDTPQ